MGASTKRSEGARLGRWRHAEAVEFATLAWADWFHTRRLLEPIGYLPPAAYLEETLSRDDIPPRLAWLDLFRVEDADW